MSETALIIGVSGQDGGYLARHLLRLGHQVHGSGRDMTQAPETLRRLGIAAQVACHRLDPTRREEVATLVRQIAPTRLFFLAGPSSVGRSFERPAETEAAILGSIEAVLAAAATQPHLRLYHAASGDCFGQTPVEGADERQPYRPVSPYGQAKAIACQQVAEARRKGRFAVSGIAFNHESPLRGRDFVTRKIADGVAAIARGEAAELTLGRLDVRRDWGWAPEFVTAMAAMLERDLPEDFVLATGRIASLEELVAAAFAAAGLDWRRHVRSDATLQRPQDIAYSLGRPDKAARELGWRAAWAAPEVAAAMVRHAMTGGEL